MNNDAPDVYVFVPGGDYRHVARSDFLKLTGPTEMPPLFALGAFDSRWYDYSEATALKQIDDYRAHRIPLDVLVVDTGWRRTLPRVISRTRICSRIWNGFSRKPMRNTSAFMFNDHPEPLSTKRAGLDAKELNYRYQRLSDLAERGPGLLVV